MTLTMHQLYSDIKRNLHANSERLLRMSILNIAMQAVGMMRRETSLDEKLKCTSNLKDIRKLTEELSGFKEAYLESLKDAKQLLEKLFIKLKLKDKYFKVFQPASEHDIEQLVTNLLDVDEDPVKLNIKRLN